MKSFLIKLIKFISLPLAFVLLSEFIIWIYKTDIYSEKKIDKIFSMTYANYHWLNNIPQKPTVLFCGNSAVRHGLNCQLLNELSKDSLSFINIGYDARDPIETYFMLKHFDLKNIKSIYFGIDPIEYTKGFYKNRSYYYYLDLNLPSCINYFRKDDNMVFFRRYQKLFEYFNTPVEIYSKSTQVPKGLGSTIITAPPVDFNDLVFEKFQIDTYGWSELQFEYLHKISKLCKEKKIDFYALIMPRRSDFTAKYIRDCKEIQLYFQNKIKNDFLPKHFVGKLNQVAYLGDDSKLYENNAHLNAQGQQYFTKQFYELLTKKAYYNYNESWYLKPNK